MTPTESFRCAFAMHATLCVTRTGIRKGLLMLRRELLAVRFILNVVTMVAGGHALIRILVLFGVLLRLRGVVTFT
jgi:hypothetical protein